MENNMDYLVIGSNGFAQVGEPAFYRKLNVEMRVLLKYFQRKFPIPRMFQTVAYYSVKTFHHDFGDYQEIVLWYDRSWLEMLEESEAESERETFDLFWSWFNVLESVDLESEELTDQIKAEYLQSLDVSKGDHFSISVAS